MRFQRGSAVSVSFVIVAEMTEFALSAWTRNVFWHSDGCRDSRICVFTSVRQCSLNGRRPRVLF